MQDPLRWEVFVNVAFITSNIKEKRNYTRAAKLLKDEICCYNMNTTTYLELSLNPITELFLLALHVSLTRSIKVSGTAFPSTTSSPCQAKATLY